MGRERDRKTEGGKEGGGEREGVMLLDLSSPHQHLPANTLLEKGRWLLEATLPARPHLPSEVCRVLWAWFLW